MEPLQIDEIVLKLTGLIDPIGETTTDDKRYNNLLTLTTVIDRLLYQVYKVHDTNSSAQEFSVKRAADHAYEFLKDVFETYEIKS